MNYFIPLLIALSAQMSWANPTILFGPEFTFYNPKCSQPSDKEVVGRLIKHLVKNQPAGCKFTVSSPPKRTKFLSPNGWFTTVGTDPGVIEFQTGPATVETFKRFKDDMQDAIFQTAANEGLVPALFLGGGHINLGLSAFSGNDLLLRNFIVDLYNHNELFMGVFNYDTHNAIAWNLLPKVSQAGFRTLVARFDRGQYMGLAGQILWLEDIQDAIISADPIYGIWQHDNKIVRAKQFSINLKNVNDSPNGRIEIRAVRPQTSMDMFVRQIELFQRRLLFLAEQRAPIPIRQRIKLNPVDPEIRNHLLTPQLDPQAALRSFYIYVTESGLPWQNHRDYLWPEWTTGGALQAFESSAWFKRHENKQCEKQLKGSAL